MNSGALFGMSLGLQAPWKITDVTLKTNDAARRELPLRIGFVTGRKFKDVAGVDCAVHGTIERQRYLIDELSANYLRISAPNTETSQHSNINLFSTPSRTAKLNWWTNNLAAS